MTQTQSSKLEQIYIPPMANVTDLVFRRLVRHMLGGDAHHVRLATEMVSSKGMMYAENPERLRLTEDEKGKVLIQIFGHEPEILAKAAVMAEKEGASGIDINMGCPVPKIVNTKDGAALMKYPELAEDIVRQVKAAVDIPVSVKTRLGWCDKTKNIKEFALRLQDAGISSLTVHGRTRKQSYSGTANWHDIAEVRELLEVPVYTNGDIVSPETAHQALDITGSHGVAVARATIGNPWILRDLIYSFTGRSELIQEPDLLERINTMELHLDWSYQDKGQKGIQVIKKHIGKYFNSFPSASKWRTAIVTKQDYNEMKDIIKLMKDSVL